MTEEKPNVEEIEEKPRGILPEQSLNKTIEDVIKRLEQIEHNQGILAKNQKRMNATLMEIFNK